MAKQANVVQEGIDQVRGAVKRAEREFGKIQKRVETRRKSFEKDVAKRRKAFEKRTQRELRRVEGEIRKQPVVKRVEAFQKDLTKQLEKGVDTVLGALPIATKREVAQLDRKLSTINRKLRAIEKAQAETSVAA